MGCVEVYIKTDRRTVDASRDSISSHLPHHSYMEFGTLFCFHVKDGLLFCFFFFFSFSIPGFVPECRYRLKRKGRKEEKDGEREKDEEKNRKKQLRI